MYEDVSPYEALKSFGKNSKEIEYQDDDGDWWTLYNDSPIYMLNKYKLRRISKSSLEQTLR